MAEVPGAATNKVGAFPPPPAKCVPPRPSCLDPC